MSRDWYAQFLLDRGRLDAAFEQFRGAHDTAVGLFGEGHPQTVVLLNSLGT